MAERFARSASLAGLIKLMSSGNEETRRQALFALSQAQRPSEASVVGDGPNSRLATRTCSLRAVAARSLVG